MLFQSKYGPMIQPTCSLTFEPSQLSTEWVQSPQAKSLLTEIWQEWKRDLRENADYRPDFCQIRHELWQAERGLQPYPELALNHGPSGHILGIMCGYKEFSHKYFYIHAVSIRPLFDHDGAARAQIMQSLIEAAIDESLNMGCHGWIAASPTEKDKKLWIEQGLSKHDDFTYRRMGYFQ